MCVCVCVREREVLYLLYITLVTNFKQFLWQYRFILSRSQHSNTTLIWINDKNQSNFTTIITINSYRIAVNILSCSRCLSTNHLDKMKGKPLINTYRKRPNVQVTGEHLLYFQYHVQHVQCYLMQSTYWGPTNRNIRVTYCTQCIKDNNPYLLYLCWQMLVVMLIRNVSLYLSSHPQRV